MFFHTLLSPVKPAIKSLESNEAKKKGLAASCRQTLLKLYSLKLWYWKESPAENEVG